MSLMRNSYLRGINMTTRSVPNEVDYIYHIYNRGVNKCPIFFSEKNYEYFTYKMAYHFIGKATILAYCLLPNHFHLLIKVLKPDFVKIGLQPFMIAYTRAINNEQNRIGPLFQGHYQSNIIDTDEYLLECVKYIHLNPVKAGLVSKPQEWEYSSYRIYFSDTQNTIIDPNSVKHFFDTRKEFIEFSEPDIEFREPKWFIDYK
jgi:putative transposase